MVRGRRRAKGATRRDRPAQDEQEMDIFMSPAIMMIAGHREANRALCWYAIVWVYVCFSVVVV